MKKFYKFATLLFASMALVMTACNDPAPEPEPEPKPEPPGPTPVELTFEVNVNSVTMSSVNYSVTPSIKDANYLVVLVPETYIDNAGMGYGLANALLESLRAQAADVGKTLAEYLPEVMSKGDISNMEMSGLAPATDYSIVVFGLDAELKPSTEPVCEPFSTDPLPNVECTFEVATEVFGNSVELKVTPSNVDVNWHMFIITDADYAAYTDPAGQYKFTDEELYSAYFSSEVNQYVGAGYGIEEALGALCPKGAQTLQAKGLTANTDYRYMLAAILVEGQQAYLVTTPVHDVFTTGEALASDMTFQIELGNVEMRRVDLKITPSNLEEKFTWICGVYDGVSTNTELLDKFLAENKMWLDWGMMLYTGVQDYTEGGPNFKYKVDAPDSDHYVMAVGYSGGVTTAPEVAFFRTLPAPDPADATFTVTPTDADPWGVAFSVDCSDDTSYYTLMLAEQGGFNREMAILEAENGLQEMLAMQQMFNPSATILSILSSYYWSGDITNNANGLEPEKSYTIAVLVFSNEGKVVGVHEFDGVLTTTAVGGMTPEVELIGYYSGNDENGEIFGQPEATQNRAIAAVRYNVPEGATSLNIYSSTPSSHPATMTSAELYASFWNYTQAVSLEQPYSFILLDWDSEAIVWAAVRDANGNLGEFANTSFTSTPEGKGNYADLKALVDEIYGTASGVLARPNRKSDAPCRVGEIRKSSKVEPFATVPESISRPEMGVEMALPELDRNAARLVSTPSFARVR